MIDPDAVRFGADGLVPAIVRDSADGAVLMLAWMDREALDATLATNDVHFHSRSRDALWKKGETSGNTLRVVEIAADCDADALLVTADPAGPTCHRGTRSCFDAADADTLLVTADPAGPTCHRGTRSCFDAADAPPPAQTQGFAWLEELWSTIANRAATRPEGSYTTSLLNGGVDAAARKVTEESTEVLIAAKDDAAAESTGAPRDETRAALAAETADLLYHALVVLAERDLSPAEVIAVLRGRAS